MIGRLFSHHCKSVLSRTSRFDSCIIQARALHLHEYQSKSILKRFGLNVQKGDAAATPEEALAVAKAMAADGTTEFVVKCQVLAGGRGKGTLSSGLKGGVKLCKTPEEVEALAKQMIGFNLVTHQTTAEGEKVNKILILESVNITKELYLAILLDPSAGGPVIVASQKGGIDIEEVAKESPDAVVKISLENPAQISRNECLAVARALGLDECGESLNIIDQIERLFELFSKTDATTVEINPLAVTSKCTDHLMCVDAKFNFDDNASFRQGDIIGMEDRSLVDPRERKAQDIGLSYIPMSGSIGCLVNGAGLAMATMDIVKLHGGEPANFLDVGGGASTEQVAAAFRIITEDKNVKVIFVNIFGGIMRCDVIAEGIIAAVEQTSLSLPLVVRLVGNHVAEGKQLLEKSGIDLVVVDDLETAAVKACMLASA